MAFTVIRYSERHELWENSDAISHEVWPEYNQHGDLLGLYWGRLFEEFADYQFALFDGEADEVIAEGHTYTFPDGLAPVEIDHERDRGSYREPNVWIVHVL